MKSTLHIAILPVLAVLCCWTFTSVVSQTTDLDFSDKLFADYKVYSLGDTVDLHCNNTSVQSIQRPNDTDPVSWMLNLPNLTIISNTVGKYRMSEDKWTLTIQNASKDDLGQYHCMLIDMVGEYYLVTVGLNVAGPYFENLTKKYDTNIMIAFCALGGFLILAAVVILLYVFRYQSDDDDDDDDSNSSSGSKTPSTSEIQGVKSVPGYTPYHTKDGKLNPTAPAKDASDSESKSSDESSGHGSKETENAKDSKEIAAFSAVVDDGIEGMDNKGFEADHMEMKDVEKEAKTADASQVENKAEVRKTEVEVHSTDNSSMDSDHNDNDNTSM